MKAQIRKVLRWSGFDIVRYRAADEGIRFTSDVSYADRRIVLAATPHSMTSVERLLATIQSVRHVVHAGIPGSIVECGVWKGGSMVAAALTLLEEGDASRDIYLYDTFEGMTAPTDEDKAGNVLASVRLAQTPKGTGTWCYAPLEDVRRNMLATHYPQERVHLIKGPVEETIPSQSPPSPIAVLRLDTDWYESTRHELMHLFSLVSDGGIVMIDDYGHWQGSRKATDEFLSSLSKRYFLHRIDYTGRMLVK